MAKRKRSMVSTPARQVSAVELVAKAFRNAGWKVDRPDADAAVRSDLLVRRHGFVYAVEVKAGPEGRSDRLVPLLSQAVLQAARAAGGVAAPLAMVAAPRVPESVAEELLAFARDYVPGTAVGVVDSRGLRLFRGRHLGGLDAEPKAIARRASSPVTGHLFSDLNQWMLKVLLAPDLPDDLLSAPRARVRNASELARAANVSVMSAFRFVQRLRQEGHLDESGRHIALVRRGELLDRWQASAFRPARDMPMRFVLPGNGPAQIRRIIEHDRACLALFAAADALNLGFVRGVPPYVYVDDLDSLRLAAWKEVRVCGPDESADLILREAPAPESVFRGMVRRGDLAACDVLQVWVDVAVHPSRGREQAELIHRRVLRRLLEGER